MTKLEETLYTALQYLYDEQNGPPWKSEKRKDEWQEAMNIAKYAMRQFERQDDAAPDLLEALEDLINQCEKEQGEFYWWIDLKQARAAIAKAKGEGA